MTTRPLKFRKTIIIAVGTLRYNMVKSKFQALAQFKDINCIINVRDNPKICPNHKMPKNLEKIRFSYPPFIIQRIFGRIIPKLILTMILVFKYQPWFLISCAIVPNGVICYIVSVLFDKVWIHDLMCGKNEILIGPNHTNQKLKRIKNKRAGKAVENILKYILRKADVVAVMGQNSKNFLIREVNIKKDDIFIISGSYDIRRFKIEENQKELYEIITVAYLRPEKRIDRFIKVIEILKKRYPKIKSAIVGEGREKRKLEKLTYNKGLRENIKFIGWTNSPEKYLKRAKIFLLTSDTEGLSIAAIEAMACGLPVVCTKVGNMKDIVIDEKTGFIVDSFSPVDLAKVVNNMIKNSAQTKVLGQNSYKLIKERYTIESEKKKWSKALAAIKKKFHEKQIIKKR